MPHIELIAYTRQRDLRVPHSSGSSLVTSPSGQSASPPSGVGSLACRAPGVSRLHAHRRDGDAAFLDFPNATKRPESAVLHAGDRDIYGEMYLDVLQLVPLSRAANGSSRATRAWGRCSKL